MQRRWGAQHDFLLNAKKAPSVICYFYIHLQAAENGSDFKSPEMHFESPEMDFKSPEMDFTSPETDFTFFIFEVHFRLVKSIFNGYLQMDLTFSKYSIFDRLHTPEVY